MTARGRGLGLGAGNPGRLVRGDEAAPGDVAAAGGANCEGVAKGVEQGLLDLLGGP